jgi:hypothetical protein
MQLLRTSTKAQDPIPCGLATAQAIQVPRQANALLRTAVWQGNVHDLITQPAGILAFVCPLGQIGQHQPGSFHELLTVNPAAS